MARGSAHRYMRCWLRDNVNATSRRMRRSSSRLQLSAGLGQCMSSAWRIANPPIQPIVNIPVQTVSASSIKSLKNSIEPPISTSCSTPNALLQASPWLLNTSHWLPALLDIQQYKMYDLTEQFFSYANSKPQPTDSVTNRSAFLDMSSSIAYELQSQSQRLSELQTLIQREGRLGKSQTTLNRMFMQHKEAFKQIESRVKKLALAEYDGRVSRRMKTTLKEAILVIVETRYIRLTLRYKRDYEDKSRLQATIASRSFDGAMAKSKNIDSRCFDEERTQLIEQTSKKEYEQIEKSMVEIAEMLKHSAMLVKLQQGLVQSIECNTTDAVDHVTEGRRNLSQIQKREQSNRKFILRVFMLLYVFVFVYVVFLL